MTWPEKRNAAAPVATPLSTRAAENLNLAHLDPLADLMPVPKAARIAYEESLGSQFARMAENQAKGDPNGILRFYAGLVTARGDATGAVAFGQKPPSRKFTPISEDDFKGLTFIEDGSKLRQITDGSIIEFENIHVLRSSLETRLGYIREMG